MGVKSTPPPSSHRIFLVMAFKAFLSATLLACACAAPAGPPAYPAEPAYPDLPPVYKYTYAVQDDYSSSNFNAHEERDGYNANGGYQVALPDGRTQTVTYVSGPEGYVADVTYEGVAQYPEDIKSYAPVAAPVYKAAAAAPVYKAAPVVHKAAPVYHAAPVYNHAPSYHSSSIKYTTAAPVAVAVETKAVEEEAVVEEAAPVVEEAPIVKEAVPVVEEA